MQPMRLMHIFSLKTLPVVRQRREWPATGMKGNECIPRLSGTFLLLIENEIFDIVTIELIESNGKPSNRALGVTAMIELKDAWPVAGQVNPKADFAGGAGGCRELLVARRNVPMITWENPNRRNDMALYENRITLRE
jgi:hypothetical protein